MNSRERVVVFGLIAVMLTGAALSFVRRQLMRNRPSIEVGIVSSESIKLSSFPLDLNRATARQLEALPGIGPVLSQRIVEYRGVYGKFQNVSDLLKITGIGPKRLAAIERFVTVGTDSGVAGFEVEH